MADGTLLSCPVPAGDNSAPVPAGDRSARRAREALAAFGPGTLRHEIEILCAEPWSGLAALSRACAAAGLRLHALRGSGTGRVLCIADGPAEAQPLLRDHIRASGGALAVERWTTVIQFAG